MANSNGLKLGEIIQQFRTPDLVRFYTPVYSWLVNQFGHALAGFAVTLVFTALLVCYAPLSGAESVVVAIVLFGLIYGKKELGDIKRMSAKDEAVVEALQIPVAEIKADAVTDWAFVFSGILMGAFTAGALLMVGDSIWTILALLSFVFFWVLMLGPGKRFLANKNRWHRSGLPFLIDIAHGEPAFVNAQVTHIKHQVSENISSQRYVGSYTTVMKFMVGIARRRMAARDNSKKNVRYWHAQELIEHLQGNLSSTANQWPLEEAEINIVWVSTETAPTLTSAQLDILKEKVWLFGSDQMTVSAGWDLFMDSSPIELTS